MPNILVLTASCRKMGNSEILAREALAATAKKGAQTKLINLTELDIISCAGCLRCVFQGKCSGDDDMGMLVRKMIEADGLIVAAPIYLLSPASIIKQIMDRALMMSLYLDELEKKRGSLTITVAGKSDWNPIGPEVLNQFSFAYGFPVYNYLEAYAPGPGEVLLQDDLIEETAALGAGLVDYLAGKIPARTPEANQCPGCYSRSFRLLGEGRVQCPFCLVEGTLDEAGRVNISQEMLADAFWTPKHRKRHLEEWIKATRDVFLENRPLIQERLKRY